MTPRKPRHTRLIASFAPSWAAAAGEPAPSRDDLHSCGCHGECLRAPLAECACCGRGAQVVVATGSPGSQHTCSYCAMCYGLLQQMRAEVGTGATRQPLTVWRLAEYAKPQREHAAAMPEQDDPRRKHNHKQAAQPQTQTQPWAELAKGA